MFKLSMYIGRQVCICINENYIMRGLFEHYTDNQYYIVMRDGSRSYFKPDKVKWIRIE